MAQIIVNPQTGERMVQMGGQWVSLAPPPPAGLPPPGGEPAPAAAGLPSPDGEQSTLGIAGRAAYQAAVPATVDATGGIMHMLGTGLVNAGQRDLGASLIGRSKVVEATGENLAGLVAQPQGAKTLEDAWATGDWSGYLANTVGMAAGSTLPTAAAGLATVATGGGAAPALVAVGMASFGQQAGALFNELTRAGVAPEKAATWSGFAGIPMAALDTYGLSKIPGVRAAVLGAAKLGLTTEGRGVANRMLGNVMKGALAEFGTEGTQGAIGEGVKTQAIPGYQFNAASVGEQAVAGLIGGTVLGGPGAVGEAVAKPKAKTPPSEPPAPEAIGANGPNETGTGTPPAPAPKTVEWKPVYESDAPDAPIVAYVNPVTGEQRTPAQHMAPIPTPLSGLPPEIEAPPPGEVTAEASVADANGQNAAAPAPDLSAANSGELAANSPPPPVTLPEAMALTPDRVARENMPAGPPATPVLTPDSVAREQMPAGPPPVLMPDRVVREDMPLRPPPVLAPDTVTREEMPAPVPAPDMGMPITGEPVGEVAGTQPAAEPSAQEPVARPAEPTIAQEPAPEVAGAQAPAVAADMAAAPTGPAAIPAGTPIRVSTANGKTAFDGTMQAVEGNYAVVTDDKGKRRRMPLKTTTIEPTSGPLLPLLERGKQEENPALAAALAKIDADSDAATSGQIQKREALRKKLDAASKRVRDDSRQGRGDAAAAARREAWERLKAEYDAMPGRAPQAKLNAALEAVEQHSAVPAYRELAAELRALDLPTSFSSGSDLSYLAPGKKVGGQYVPGINEVQADREHGRSDRVVLHESVHAATVLGLQKNPDLMRRVEALRKKALAAVEASEQDRPFYGLQDNLEFVAEGLTNPNFQSFLRRIPADGSNLWEQFKDIVATAVERARALLKRPPLDTRSLLDELLDMRGEMYAATKAAQEPAKAAPKPEQAAEAPAEPEAAGGASEAAGNAKPKYQALPLIKREEELPLREDKNKGPTRRIAEALVRRAKAKWGIIARDDRSPKALQRIGNWMADEVEYELSEERRDRSGAGWYSWKYKDALDTFGRVFPEFLGPVDEKLPGFDKLGRDPQRARDFFTWVVAITSDGQEATSNFKIATKLYDAFRQTGTLPSNFTEGGERNKAMQANARMLQNLLETRGADMTPFLMQDETVSKLKKEAAAAGLAFKVKHAATMRLPLAALLLGPKLGSFGANLQGAHGYLTMDRWWSRSFNRYRGLLLPKISGLKGQETNKKGEKIGLARFKEMIGRPNISDSKALDLVRQYADDYADRGYDHDDSVPLAIQDREKAANTLYKAAYVSTADMPFGALDRQFMHAAAQRATEILRQRGHEVSIADLQATLWYFEKRLYATLGARPTREESFAEIAARIGDAALAGRRSGVGLDAALQGVVEDDPDPEAGLGDEEVSDEEEGGASEGVARYRRGDDAPAVKREAVTRSLRDLLNRIAGTKVRLDVDGNLTDEQGNPVEGRYWRGLISVALDAANAEGTARHEAIHFLREVGAFPPAIWQALEKQAATWRKQYRIDQRYDGLSESELNEEAIAEAYAKWAADPKKVDAALGARVGFNRIQKILEAVRAALRKLFGRMPTADEVFAAVERGEFATDGEGKAGGKAKEQREGADLDMSKEARMKRAKEMGFDSPVLYHATSQAFEEFSRDAFGTGSNAGNAERAFFFTDSTEVADTYLGGAWVNGRSPQVIEALGDRGEDVVRAYNSGSQIVPVLVRGTEGFAEWDMGGGGYDTAFMKRALQGARKDKAKGVIFRNMRDPGMMSLTRGKASDIYAVFDPAAIRSIHAAFDPKDKGKANILYQRPDGPKYDRGLGAGYLVEPDVAGTMEELDRQNYSWLQKVTPDRFKGDIGAAVDRARHLFQDRMIHLRRVQEAIEKTLGRPLTEQENAYLAEELYPSKVGEQKFRIDKDFKEPILEAMKAGGLTLDQVDDYLTARHAEERNEYIAGINPKLPDGGSGMATAEAQAILDKATPEMVRIGGLVDQMMKQRLDWLVESGVMAPGDVAAMRSRYQHYVPLRGVEEGDNEPEILRPITGSGFKGTRRKEPRATGRFTRAPDVLATAFTLADEAIIRGEKNVVGQKLLTLLQAAPDPAIAEIEPVETKAVIRKVPYKTVEGGKTVTRYRQEVDYRRQKVAPRDGVIVHVDGQPVLIHINYQPLLNEIERLGGAEVNALMSVMGKFTQTLSQLNTTLNPEFVITNAFADLQAGLANLGKEKVDGIRRQVTKNWANAFRGSYRYLRSGKADTEWAKLAQEFRAAGGATAFNQITDAKQMATGIEDALATFQTGKVATIKQGLRKVGGFIEDANASVDNAMRLSTYAALVEAGYSKAKAASVAKNLTVNFNRRGELGSAMNALFMFFNAGVQGTAVLLSAMKRPAVRKFVAAVAITGFAQEMLAGLLPPPEDDEEGLGLTAYERVPEWQKTRNMIIMNPFGDHGPGSFIAIRMPYGYNWFHNIGRLTAAYLRGAREPDGRPVSLGLTIARLGTSFGEAMMPPGVSDWFVPTIAAPFVEIAKNENYFGAPVKPTRFPGDHSPESQRYFNSVSPISREVAQFLNAMTGGDEFEPGLVDISPESIDHVLSTFSGAAGAAVLNAKDALLRGAGEATGLNAEDPQLGVRDLPFVRKVVGYSSPGQQRDVTYRRMDALTVLADREKGYSGKTDPERRDPKALAALRREHGAELALVPEANKLRRELSKIRKQRLAIVNDDAIPARDRRARTDALAERERALMRAFNQRYMRAVPAS